jgi:hypothetical protein
MVCSRTALLNESDDHVSEASIYGNDSGKADGIWKMHENSDPHLPNHMTWQRFSSL